jgi:beta-galactosidase
MAHCVQLYLSLLVLLFTMCERSESANVTYDPIALKINGERQLILSGAIHYPRSTVDMWSDLMKRSVDAGLNTIETYVFWHLHEPTRGEYHFEDNLDLRRFVKTASDHNLNVIVRIGPYICAEVNYGGFPAWLKQVPGIQFRTFNEPFMKEMSRWVSYVVDYLRPQFMSNGGNIILLQIENEYGNVIGFHGADGVKYIQWAAEFANSLNTGIPWNMCYGSAGNTLDTVNGMYGHQLLLAHWTHHPDQPGIWTENWPGWYDNWAYAFNLRPAEDVAYSVARFFAMGGTGMNYYMWHGGTNFGRMAGYLITTNYDYDAPLDEFGRPNQPKFDHLKELHSILNNNKKLLLASNERPKPQQLGPSQFAFKFGNNNGIAFLCNDDHNKESSIQFMGSTFTLAAKSVIIISFSTDSSKVTIIYDTSKPRAPRTKKEMKPIQITFGYSWWSEPKVNTYQNITYIRNSPVEQLQFTQDKSDYAFYTRTISTTPNIAQTFVLTLNSVADIAHIFVNGKYKNSTNGVLNENRNKYNGTGYRQVVHFMVDPSPNGQFELSIMVCALGLTKIENAAGGDNLVLESKGIWSSVLLNTTDITNGNWHIQAGLAGELFQIYKGSSSIQWNKNIEEGKRLPLTWWNITFNYDPQLSDFPLVIDFSGMNKGIAYLNGNCIGRYWMANATATNSFDPLKPINFGKPSQRYYHLPKQFLKTSLNSLVLFEELGGSPESITLNHVHYNA